MPFRIYLWDSLSAIEWSQSVWHIEGLGASPETCDGELIRPVMLRHLPRDGVVLDAGCGTARWPIYLRRRGYTCVGLEIALRACRYARELEPGFGVACADTKAAPIRDGAVDAVMSLGVVEHEESGPDASLRELHRILRPGGVLVLAVPFNNLFRRLVMNHAQRWITWRRRRAGMKLAFAEYRFTKREVDRFVRAAGFTPIDWAPNDLEPPKNMGLWLDFDNLVLNPFLRPPKQADDMFRLQGLPGRLASAAVRHAPWLVCGEVVCVARRA